MQPKMTKPHSINIKQTQGKLLIFITGVFKGGKHALEARQKYGAAGYFEKPFEASKLLEAVQKLLPAEKKAPAPSSLEEAFEVELDIVVTCSMATSPSSRSVTNCWTSTKP